MRIPKKVADRFAKQVAAFQRVLKQAQNRDVNESDTVTIVTDILSEVLGFDKYTEVTSELAIRGTYCDLATKLDGKIKYLVEVKAVGLNLKENHLRQAVNYGANHGIPWVVLTNGVNWVIYRIKFERPIDYELVCDFDFTQLNGRRQQDQERLFLLSKEGLAKAAIDEFHDHVKAVNRFVLGAILRTEPVIKLIRRELRKISPDVKVTTDEIAHILRSDVLKRDVVDGSAAQNAESRIKKGTRRRQRRGSPELKAETPEESQSPTE